MRRLLLGVALISVAALLGGCPLYSTTSDYPACGADGPCFDCPSGSTPSDGTCIPWQCSSSRDCPSGYACSGNACIPAADASDCSGGCPANDICKLANGIAQCVPASSVTDDAATGPNADASSTGPTPAPSDSGLAAIDSSLAPDSSVSTDAAFPPEAGEAPVAPDSSSGASDALNASDGPFVWDASDASTASGGSDGAVPLPCNANADCGGSGAKCIDGACTPQARLCSDTTQCIVASESCIDGVCEPHCSLGVPCPGGYGCDFTRGVCNVNSSPCSGSGTSTCQGGSTCVEGHCVPPCAGSDAGAACPAGQLCVNGGCIPDEAAHFDCKNDGHTGEFATVCAATAICLHHDCYVGCDPDAGAAACSDQGTACKPVSVTAGTYLVCAAPSTLGSDCDPAAGKYCAGTVCVDGYCR